MKETSRLLFSSLVLVLWFGNSQCRLSFSLFQTLTFLTYYSEILTNWQVKATVPDLIFDALPILASAPREGDIFLLIWVIY